MKKLTFFLLILVLIGCQSPVSPTPSLESPAPTVTFPSPSPTQTSTLESLPPTEPPLPTLTPTPDTGHNPTAWHFPSNFPGFEHHHGVNPENYIDIFGPTLSSYLATYGTVSYPWHTPDENSMEGLGHHHGYVWLYDHARGDETQPGCELFNNGGNLPTDTLNCVTDVLIELHTDGTQAHLRKRFHSHYVFMRVCDQTLTQCGIVATGGWVDYGILHTPYKKVQCPLPGIDPEVPEGYVFNLDQPPYRTSFVEYRGDRVVQFWSGLHPNQVVADIYPEDPNATVGVAWSTIDAWGYINPEHCDDPAYDVFGVTEGRTELNNSLFQIFTIFLYDHPPAPFVGWTDRWGHVVEGCTQADTDCVPFVVTEGVPDGGALLNRPVKQGDPEAAPLLEFDPGAGVLLAPDR